VWVMTARKLKQPRGSFMRVKFRHTESEASRLWRRLDGMVMSLGPFLLTSERETLPSTMDR
jgi:hypothetical protein